MSILCIVRLMKKSRVQLVADNSGRAEGKHNWSMRSCTLAVVTLRATPRAENIAYGVDTKESRFRPHPKTLHSKLVLSTLLRLLPRPRERWYDPSNTATVTSN
jgi:hypothetical protein